MEDTFRLRFQRGDLLIIGAVLLCGAVLGVWLVIQGLAVDQVSVRVYRDGVLLRELPLTQPQEFVVTGDYNNTVTVRDGRVAITHSDCPGGDCVYSGWVSDAGRAIVCLPNRVEIRLAGMTEIDAVAG